MKQSKGNNKQEIDQNSLQSWVQFEQIKLSRLKQQRQRMQNMKYVVQKYSQIIKQLEMKNKDLYNDNQKLKQQLMSYQSQQNINADQFDNIKLIQQLQYSLKRQQNHRKKLQITIQQLKDDIATLSSHNYNNSRMNSSLRNTYQVQYETLRDLYQDLKNQIQIIKKQNNYLQTILFSQQKIQQKQYQFLTFKLDSRKNAQYNHKKQQLAFNHSLRLNKESNISNLTSKDTIKTNNQNDLKYKMRQLKNQNKKLYELVYKFKKNEQQQQQIIEKLRNSDAKMCLCHIHGVRPTSNIMQTQKIKQRIIQNNNKIKK